MFNNISELAKQVKSRIAFDELFRKLYPDHYEPRGNSRCPFHDDDRVSFEIHTDHGYDHGGCKPPGNSKSWDIFSLWQERYKCDFKAAVQELAGKYGIDKPQSPSHIVATYDYTDESGNLLYQVVRLHPKDFRQRTPGGKGGWSWRLGDTRRVLYRLPAVIQADEVWLTEGEKDSDALVNFGLCGTTAPQGAGKWSKILEDGQPPTALKNKIVHIIPDCDGPGRQHAHDIARSLAGFAASVKILEMPGLKEKQDVSDFIEKHGEKAKSLLLELAESSPEYQPAAETRTVERAAEKLRLGEAINLTDTGNARRLANLFGSKIRFSRHLGWLIYDGKRWTSDDLASVQRFAKETVQNIYAEAAQQPDEDSRRALASFALKCESAGRIEAMIKLVPSEPGISVLPEFFDRDKMLFNVVNGTLDLRTGALRPHSPADLITKIAPVEYDPTAKCERWTQFIVEIMDGDEEMGSFLQRGLGYTLTGATKEQVWFFLYGTGENGKTTLLHVLERILGDYCINTPADTFVITPGHRVRDDLARLRGARLISASEAEGKTFDAETIKAFTGEGTVSARELYHKGFDYQPDGKIFFSANNQPEVKDTSHAFWRRILLIPFTRQFTGGAKDDNLRAKLAAESPGILAWMVRGCLDWQALGLQIPDKVKLAVNDYRDSTDILKEFLESHCVVSPGLRVPVSALRSRYVAYCEEHKIKKPMSSHKFNNHVLTRAGITRGLDGPKTSRVKTWFGIGLQESALRSCTVCNFNGEACREFGIREKDATKCQYYATY